jgi:SPP1 gp7 family putative phage head morphogenesis protein
MSDYANKIYLYRAYDPTHTTTIRNAFVGVVDKRFDALISVIKRTVVENDCFGLKPGVQTHEMVPAGWQAFNYRLSQEKVAKFMEWLQTQVNTGILTIQQYEQVGTAINTAWTNLYISDSYKKGIIRARYELQKAGYNVPSIESTGGITMSLALPIHLDRLGLLFLRAYTDLKGITETMSSQISRILAQGLADGDNPLLLARKMVAIINGQGIGDLGITNTLGKFVPAKVRAEGLARTEVIRAHNAATIQEYRNWGVIGVNVLAEVVTAGDNKVCSVCNAIAKNGPYTLDEAEKMLPAHTNCRCCFIPKLVE